MSDISADKNNQCQIVFDLSISPIEYQQYYRGEIKWVITNSLDGRKVQFPANLLTQHVTHEGIHGRFVLHYLASGKALKLDKLG
ncbi:DUF2835 family protein [Aliikangiella marina]|uniref:DUF2835 family protein n=1 Tax=Aliikangiella marina TaxID=1712262 RepID=A0A545TH71_9GAMM|nr:DUF2835 family protein [Aliikangiella marina]TQV76583.1 DUF2835 family protein [Aliikangiella marina]